MAERKIFNFKSEIIRELTFEKEGYYPESLGRTSNKFIYATCRFCGNPSRIRNGFFTKTGSACHNECRLKEQSIFGSPFRNEGTKEKTKQTNLKKYGFIHACQNKDVSKKISESKRKEDSKNKTKKTNIERYGVDNVFKSQEIKEKIKLTLMEKYDSDSPLKSFIIRNKFQETIFNKYGVKNICHIPGIVEKRKNNFNETVKNNIDGKYDIVKILRNEDFWENIKLGKSLKEICDIHNMKYSSIATSLSRDEFKYRFRKEYCYPKNQKQNDFAKEIEKFNLHIISSSRDIISPLELDIFIPEKNFAIEFNGSCWHSEKILDSKIARNKHIKKMYECRDKNIRLINIFEKTWDEKRKQVLNFIKSSLGLNQIKIDARKCDLEEKDCVDFIENNHIQGWGNRTIKTFTLVFYNKIVGAMTASSHHRQNTEGNPIILNRLCFLDNTSVRGGASKLFSAFKKWAKEQKYDRIISFSDNCLTEGGIYKSLDFKMTKEYGPDYFYWDEYNNKYLSKQSQRKKNVNCPETFTEKEWAKQNNKYRIWDCGKKRWEYYL